MTGALLILGCLASWVTFNMVIGLALTKSVRQAIAGTALITATIWMIGIFVVFLAVTVGHFT